MTVGGDHRPWLLCVKLVHTLTGSCLQLPLVPHVGLRAEGSCACGSFLHLLSCISKAEQMQLQIKA